MESTCSTSRYELANKFNYVHAGEDEERLPTHAEALSGVCSAINPMELPKRQEQSAKDRGEGEGKGAVERGDNGKPERQRVRYKLSKF